MTFDQNLCIVVEESRFLYRFVTLCCSLKLISHYHFLLSSPVFYLHQVFLYTSGFYWKLISSTSWEALSYLPQIVNPDFVFPPTCWSLQTASSLNWISFKSQSLLQDETSFLSSFPTLRAGYLGYTTLIWIATSLTDHVKRIVPCDKLQKSCKDLCLQNPSTGYPGAAQVHYVVLCPR